MLKSRTAIVVPCFNEAARLDAEAFLTFVEVEPGVDFFFVDDGSTDETFALLKSLESKAPGQINAIQLSQNRGKAEAVRSGMNCAFEAGCDYAGFWDADLATPLPVIADFRQLLEARSDLRAVIGARVKLLGRHVERHRRRHYTGRLFATAAALALGFAVYDTQCGAKLWRSTPHNRALFEEEFIAGWVFDVELLARMLSDRGASPVSSIVEFPLLEWRDVEGSKVRLSHLPGAAFDLLRIAVRYRRHGAASTT